jgi:hypothetical protein
MLLGVWLMLQVLSMTLEYEWKLRIAHACWLLAAVPIFAALGVLPEAGAGPV